jgi:hypothetical protein
MALGSHQQCVGKSQDHVTPLWLLRAIGAHGEIDGLGGFDLDPAAADPRPWDCARVNWSSHGLERDWPRDWSVYLNPPFHRYEVGAWIKRLAKHGNGIALLHARTEAEWFEPIWQHASGILFLGDRIKFCRPDGSEQPHNSGAPAILVAFGDNALARLRRCGIPGVLVTGWEHMPAASVSQHNRPTTEGCQVMKQMYAELIFDHPHGRDLAVAELTKRGFDVEILNWVDEYEGVLLTSTVWVKVRGASELDENEFFREMGSLAGQFDGDVIEAGLA